MSWGEIKKVNDDLSTPLNRGGVKVVKSIQRGVCKMNSTVTFDEVDLDKTMVILNSAISVDFYTWGSYRTGTYSGVCYLNSISPTSMTISGPTIIPQNASNICDAISYQIIEFY